MTVLMLYWKDEGSVCTEEPATCPCPSSYLQKNVSSDRQGAENTKDKEGIGIMVSIVCLSISAVCHEEKLILRKARRSLCDPRQTDTKGGTTLPPAPVGAVQLITETIPRLTQLQFVINGAVETGSKTDHQVHTRDGLHIVST